MTNKKISTAKVKGISGQNYTFEVYNMDVVFRSGIPGVYMIARRRKTSDNNYTLDPIFVGETSDISLICGFHKKQACFQKYHPNCRCILKIFDPQKRKEIVQDLIDQLEPFCND